MRFVAPLRLAVDPRCFAHPVFADVAPWREMLVTPDWPSVADIDAMLGQVAHSVTGRALRAVAQTPGLLRDGQHYETRIFAEGVVATRENSWHDLLNALVWARFSAIKSAINSRQAADIATFGSRSRTRGQCALTHFDEAGVVVVLRDRERLEAWDRHDWVGFFGGLQSSDFAIAVIGHALLEHAVLEPEIYDQAMLAQAENPGRLLVGKALVALADDPQMALARSLAKSAQAIAESRLLADPQELRPLPLMGLPGWHPLAGQAVFLTGAPCFAGKRASRVYPPVLEISVGALNAAA